MAWDVGDVVPLGVEVRDSAGDLAAAGAIACTITLPDGTTATPAVITAATGRYSAQFTATQAGPHGVRWVATGANASAWHDGFYIRPVSTPLVSLSEIKTHLNIAAADTADDEELRDKLAAAHDAVAANLQRPVTRETRTDVLMPRGPWTVVLPKPDVTSVTSVTVAGATLDPDDYTLDVRTGTLTRSAGWSGPVTVVWVTRPVDHADVRNAVMEMCRHLWETQRGSARSLPRRGGDGPAPAGYALPNRVTELLAPHRSRT